MITFNDNKNADDTEKNPQIFICNFCDFETSKLSNFLIHKKTRKHAKNVNDNKMVTNDNFFMPKNATLEYRCNCGNTYKYKSGLSRHKKNAEKCRKMPIEESNKNDKKINNKDELILMLIKENSEFKSIIMEQQNMMMKVIENGANNITNNITNNTTNTNSNNKAFNLNFFLNETCKNAMNISEFIDSIKLQLSDFIEVGELGYIQGISNIIVKKLNDLDESLRPIHCTDQKRETFYIKDENKWEKEEEDLKKIRKMISKIAYKNQRLLFTYKEKYPDYKNPDSKRSDQYSKFVIEALGGKGENNKEKENKIIKHISKATIIKNK
jgi:hypothetical protein